jgi:hypothetical protein
MFVLQTILGFQELIFPQRHGLGLIYNKISQRIIRDPRIKDIMSSSSEVTKGQPCFL